VLLSGAVAATGLAHSSGFVAQPATPPNSRIRLRCETCQGFFTARSAAASVAGVAVKQRRRQTHVLAAAASTAQELVSLRLVVTQKKSTASSALVVC
jgi:hypothetical protein